jgi:hypothetical protein
MKCRAVGVAMTLNEKPARPETITFTAASLLGPSQDPISVPSFLHSLHRPRFRWAVRHRSRKAFPSQSPFKASSMPKPTISHDPASSCLIAK